MAEETLSPLLALIKSKALLTTCNLRKSLRSTNAPAQRSSKSSRIFGIMDLDTILQLEANHLGAQVVSLNDTEFSPELLQTVPANTARMYRCIPVDNSIPNCRLPSRIR